MPLPPGGNAFRAYAGRLGITCRYGCGRICCTYKELSSQTVAVLAVPVHEVLQIIDDRYVGPLGL